MRNVGSCSEHKPQQQHGPEHDRKFESEQYNAVDEQFAGHWIGTDIHNHHADNHYDQQSQ